MIKWIKNITRKASKKTRDESGNTIDWSLRHNVFLTTAHITGKENSIADAESRKSRKDLEWLLNQNIFERGICQLSVKPTTGLSASRLNYKIKPFLSEQPKPEAQIINAFTVSWQTYLFYAFPPFIVIPLVLQKVQEEQSTEILVVPKWPMQSWWPALMRMIIQHPISLPRTKKTLFNRPIQIYTIHCIGYSLY